MLNKIKIPAIVVLSSIVILWVLISSFKYLTHKNPPEIKLLGLENSSYYSGELNFNIKADNKYKISEINILLDGKELMGISNPKYIGAKRFDLPIKLDTTIFPNGEHKIEIESIDSSYHKNKNTQTWVFNIDNTPLKAALLKNDFEKTQGKTVHLKIQVNKQLEKAELKIMDKIYNCIPESELSTTYECFIPIDCETNPGDYPISIELQDKVKNKINLMSNLKVTQFTFIKQKGFSIAQGKLEEEKSVSMSNKILEDALEKWLKNSPAKKIWSGPFEIPLDMKKLATPFGEVRMSQEKGRYIHKAVDILNYPKCVVWASQAGKVIIKDRFLMSGNTIVLDHGLGIFTLYYHLEDFADIEIGDTVKKGTPLGKMGMTGYANGYHLHWELRVNNIAVDPFEWTDKNF